MVELQLCRHLLAIVTAFLDSVAVIVSPLRDSVLVACGAVTAISTDVTVLILFTHNSVFDDADFCIPRFRTLSNSPHVATASRRPLPHGGERTARSETLPRAS